MSARALLASGSLYLAPIVAGIVGVLAGPFECDKFAITPKSTLKTAKSKSKESYGQIIEAVSIPDVPDFEIDITEVNKTTLAYGMLAAVNNVSTIAGTLTDEAHTLGALDAWFDIGKPFLRVTELTNSAGTTTYDEGVDYIVNEDLGWIKPLESGSMTANEAVKITGTTLAFAGASLDGMVNTQLRVKAFFDGKNLADDSSIQVTAYEVILQASDVFDFLASDFNKVNLKGTLKTPAGFVSPFTIKMLQATS